MAQNTRLLLQAIGHQAVIPVVAVETVDQAVDLAGALAAGGLKAIEITLRTPIALEAIKAVANEVENAVVGAGTILGPRQFDQAIDAGARFIVSPGTTMELLDAAKGAPVPLMPGAATASELMAMTEEGYEILKFFPAEQSGGAAFLKAVAPVFPHLRFCPTGGVSEENAGSYLSLPNVICVGGSWVAPKDLLAEGRFAEITRLALEAAKLKSHG